MGTSLEWKWKLRYEEYRVVHSPVQSSSLIFLPSHFLLNIRIYRSLAITTSSSSSSSSSSYYYYSFFRFFFFLFQKPITRKTCEDVRTSETRQAL